MKHRRIIISGKAAAGKDFLRKRLENRGFTYGISYTTRPKRPTEIDGKDYYFLSIKDFEKKIEQGFWYEYVKFNGWYYGTSKDQFYSDDIFIMTPTGISLMKPKDRLDSFIVYLDVPEEVRKQRLLERKDADSVDRRLKADAEDFKGFSDFDIRITNPNF